MTEHRHGSSRAGSGPGDEIDLSFIADILIRRRKTIFATLAAGLLCAMIMVFLILTPKYQIGALVRPGITGFDDKGEPVSDFKAEDFKAWIEGKAYEQVLFKKFGNELPDIKASLDRKGTLITLTLYHEEPDTGKAIIREILAQITHGTSGLNAPSRLRMEQVAIGRAIDEKRRELKMIDTEKERINTKIGRLRRDIELIAAEKKDVENEIAKLKKELEMIDVERAKISRKMDFLSEQISSSRQHIETLKKDQEALEKARISLKDKIAEINKNTEELINLRNDMIKTTGHDKIALLMFSNIIQENIGYVSNLEQRALELAKEANHKTNEINEQHLKIEQLKKEIDLLKIQQEEELSQKKFNIEIEIAKQKRKKEEVLGKKHKDILSQIHDLEMKRDKDLEKKRHDIQDEIGKLKAQLDSLALVEVVQPPYSSPEPVKPNKALILALTLCSCLVLGIIFAFLKEFWAGNRENITI